MGIDFKNEVLKRRDDIVKATQEILRINSELTSFDPERTGAPFGEGIKESLEYLLKRGKKDGFAVENVEGYAGHIEYGNQDEYVGMMGHVDVVPAGNDWKYEPYSATINDNKIYARGAEDDKGPTIAAYFAMKILKDLGLPLSKRIKLVLCGDEETAWRCVRHYFVQYPQQPVSGFIPDADFPLIYAEKGIAKIVLTGPIKDRRILSIDGGHVENMVPDYASVTLSSSKKELQSFYEFINKTKYTGSFLEGENSITYKINGKSAHGSTPELGHNAIDRIFEFLQYLEIENNLTMLYQALLSNDNYGEKLDVIFHNEEMGALTNNVGTLRFHNNNFRLELNLRYPQGINLDDIMAEITSKTVFYETEVALEKHQLLLYNDPNSELVKTLMNVYHNQTGDHQAKPLTIGGGTFARAMKNTVAFGPHFPGKPSYIHQKNEHIEIDDLLKATAIYAEALYKLAK